jgi:hypothetical protein
MWCEWFLEPAKSLMVLNSPDGFYLRLSLETERFPGERQIEIPATLKVHIEAQEREGWLVF